MVVERSYSRDPKALLALVVNERDMRSAFLSVEEVYPKLVDPLNNEYRDRLPVDRGPSFGEVGGTLSVGVG